MIKNDMYDLLVADKSNGNAIIELLNLRKYYAQISHIITKTMENNKSIRLFANTHEAICCLFWIAYYHGLKKYSFSDIKWIIFGYEYTESAIGRYWKLMAKEANKTGIKLNEIRFEISKG